MKNRAFGIPASEEEQNSLNPDYAEQVAYWHSNKEEFEKHGGFFEIGRTTKALKSIGIKEQNIVFDKQKKKEIMNKHPEMTIDVIKEIPKAIAKPIIVMQSKTVKDSVTIYGDVYATVEGIKQPVMIAMLLSPTGKSGRILNLEKISSSYVRGAEKGQGNDTYIKAKAQDLIDTSDILYIEPNKNRTNTWLRALGLHLPSGLTKYGPIERVTYYNDVVKNQDKVFGQSAFEDAFIKAGIKTISTAFSDKEIEDHFILELKKNNFSPTPALLSYYSNLYHKTNKLYSLEEISSTYKNPKTAHSPSEYETIKQIGDLCRTQEVQRAPSCCTNEHCPEP